MKCIAHYEMRVMTPNGPKLSDTPERRGTCVVGGKVAVEAGAVTRRRVRCSAWLGVGCIFISVLDREESRG